MATLSVAHSSNAPGSGQVVRSGGEVGEDAHRRLVAATDSGKPTLLVSLGSPYLLNQVPTAGSYLIAWSGARVAERAVALAILGRVPVTGRLPIRLPRTTRSDTACA